MPVGNLVTLDQIYEVQHSALDSDVQATMARVLSHCAQKQLPVAARAAKAVALLELIQDTVPTDATLVARCLFDRLDRGKHGDQVAEALEELRRSNLLGYSEKQGYKIQSSSGEEWERERRDIPVARDYLIGLVQESLKYLLSQPSRPALQGRGFPWMAYFTDSQRASDVLLLDPRDPANVTVDLRLLSTADRDPKIWVNRTAEDALTNRIVWIAQDPSDVESQAREYGRSLAMVQRYKPRRESLTRDRQRLLLEEEARAEELERRLQSAVDAAWMAGTVYFRGRAIPARELGGSFAVALGAAGGRFLPDLFPSFLATQLSPTEMLQLLETSLTAPSPKFIDELGLLSLDSGKYVPSCEGVAPQRRADWPATARIYRDAFGGHPASIVPAAYSSVPKTGQNRRTSRPHLALRGTTWHYVAQGAPYMYAYMRVRRTSGIATSCHPAQLPREDRARPPGRRATVAARGR